MPTNAALAVSVGPQLRQREFSSRHGALEWDDASALKPKGLVGVRDKPANLTSLRSRTHERGEYGEMSAVLDCCLERAW